MVCFRWIRIISVDSDLEVSELEKRGRARRIELAVADLLLRSSASEMILDSSSRIIWLSLGPAVTSERAIETVRRCYLSFPVVVVRHAVILQPSLHSPKLFFLLTKHVFPLSVVFQVRFQQRKTNDSTRLTSSSLLPSPGPLPNHLPLSFSPRLLSLRRYLPLRPPSPPVSPRNIPRSPSSLPLLRTSHLLVLPPSRWGWGVGRMGSLERGLRSKSDRLEPDEGRD